MWTANLTRIVFALGCLLAVVPARADDSYPNRPVRIIVPSPPGGAYDNVGRPITRELAQELGQPFVMESRSGGSGIIAIETLQRAPKDGYSLLLSVNATLTILPHTRKVEFDPLKDIVPVATLSEIIAAVAVNNNVPAKTLRAFVDYARANPGKVAYGSSGIGSNTHMRLEMLNRLGDMKMLHVPYRGDSDMIVDLIAGHVQVGATSALLPLSRQGQVRLIAFMAPQRYPDLPDIPTVAEVLPGFNMPTWYGLFAATGTPPAILSKLNTAMNAILAKPDVAEYLLKVSNIVQPESLDVAAKRLSDGFKLYGRIVNEMGIKEE